MARAPPGRARRLAAAGCGALAAVAGAAAGVDRRRTLPALAPRRLSRPAVRDRPDVWLWADTFTDHFRPGPAIAAIEVLAAAGLAPGSLPEPPAAA